MAIQIPNPGTGNGATGDNEFVLWSKVKDNFSDQTNAASKIVGTGSGQIPMAQDSYKAAFSQPLRTTTGTDVNEMPVGEMLMYGTTAINTPVTGYAWIVRSILDYTGSFTGQFQIAHQYEGGTVYTRQKKKMEWTEWAKHYTSANTTKDSKSNLLLASGDTIPNTSAASRLVGEESGNVMEVGAYGWGAQTIGELPVSQAKDVINMRTGMYFYPPEKAQELHPEGVGSSWGDRGCFILKRQDSQAGFCFWFPYHTGSKNNIYFQSFAKTTKITHKFYTDKNTKLDTNGAIAPSSPTIDLYSDRIETNEDGARMNPEFIRNGVGDYTIKNTTGLRDEGWYVKIPNDMNGNPKVAITVDTDKDGNLSIKTYRRIFSMETFTFIPDLETPLDIPEGRWIDLRFNDLPNEELYEPEPEEADLDK